MVSAPRPSSEINSRSGNAFCAIPEITVKRTLRVALGGGRYRLGTRVVLLVRRRAPRLVSVRYRLEVSRLVEDAVRSDMPYISVSKFLGLTSPVRRHEQVDWAGHAEPVSAWCASSPMAGSCTAAGSGGERWVMGSMDVASWVTLPFAGERLASVVHIGNGKDAELLHTFAGGRRV